MLICCLQYAWTYVIARHGIQLDSVQWDHKISMVGYHNHVSTASSQRDCVSQSNLSHYNLANRCGWRSSSHIAHSAKQDMCQVTVTQKHTILLHGRYQVSIFLYFFCTLQQTSETYQRGCLVKQDMSAGDNANCCSGRLSKE